MAPRRFRKLFRLPFTRPDPAEVDDEFRFHLAMRAHELETAGHSPERARELALGEFGDIDDARKFCRTEDEGRMREHRRSLWFDNLRQDLRVAIRTLRRQPSFVVSTVLTLAVAIGLAATAYGVVHAYLVRPLPYPDADRLVRVRQAPTPAPFPNAPSLEGVDWSVADRVFDATLSWNPDGFTIAGGDRTESVRGAWVSPGYFTVLGLRPARGRAFDPGEHVASGPVTIISDALWARLYGRDPSLIGRAVRVQSLEVPGGAELVTVVGIMPPDAWHIDRFTDVLRPQPGEPRFPSMARLEPGMSIAEAERRLNAAVLPQLGTVDPAYRLSLVGVQEEYTFRVRPTLLALMGGALFLLLIAGANVAGAQTARAAARRAEIQVRLALGASRTRVALQLLVESFVVAFAAAVVGAVVAGSALTIFGTVVGERLGASVPGGSERLALGAGMLLLLIAAGTLIGTAFGLLPAVVFTRAASRSGGRLESLGGQKGAARSLTSPLLRRGLIVAQVGFTMMLLVGAGLMARTILAIAITPLGFNQAGVLKGDMFLPPSRYRDAQSRRSGVERLLAGAAAVPGVRAVAAAIPDPLQSYTMPTLRVTGEAAAARGDSGRQAVRYVVTPDYFQLLDIPVKAGRGFGEGDAAESAPVAVISESVARALWPGETGIGRRVRADLDSVWRTVIGVVGETRQPVESSPVGELYVPYAQNPIELIFLLARVTGDPAATGGLLQRAVTRVDDHLALANVGPLSDVADRATGRHRALATVLSLFAVLALGLAILGLYASLAYVVAQRRREIAIRVAVGADAWSIGGLVAREGAVLVAAGLMLGLALSLSVTRLLQSQLYGVTPTDPATFAVIVSVLGGAGLVAALVPLRQATRVDPVEILRSE